MLTSTQSQWASAVKDDTMNTRLFTFLLILTISITSYAETEMERKAGVAGKYWGAVIMASEFKKTNCGNSIKIDNKWIDVDRASLEIKSRFPESSQIELNQAFSFQKESEYRKRTYLEWSKIPPEKCIGARTLFWTIFDSAVTDWQAIK